MKIYPPFYLLFLNSFWLVICRGDLAPLRVKSDLEIFQIRTHSYKGFPIPNILVNPAVPNLIASSQANQDSDYVNKDIASCQLKTVSGTDIDWLVVHTT